MLRQLWWLCALLTLMLSALPGREAQAQAPPPTDPKAAKNQTITRLQGELARLLEGGAHAKALPVAQRLLKAQEAAVGAEHPDLVPTLSSLTSIHSSLCDTRAVEAAAPRGKTPEQARMELHLSTCERDYNLPIEPLIRRSLAIAEKAFGPQDPRVASVLRELALVLLLDGREGEVEPVLRRVIAIDEQELKRAGPQERDAALTSLDTDLDMLVWVYVDLGDIPAAVRAREQRSARMWAEIKNMARQLGEHGQARWADLFRYDTDQVMSLHLQTAPSSQEAARFALSTILQRKERFLELTARAIAAAREHGGATVRAELDKLTAMRHELAGLITAGRGSATQEEHRARVTTLAQQLEGQELAVMREALSLTTEEPAVRLEDVQAAIPGDSVLVEIVRYRPFPFLTIKMQRERKQANTDELTFGPPRYVAYVARRQGDVGFVELGGAEPIDKAALRFRAALENATGDTAPSARALDELVTKPIRRLIGDARDVFLSPDGALNAVPFAALIDEQGRYLVERYSITYLGSGRDLMRMKSASPAPKQPPLIFGNPAFDAAPPSASPAADPPADTDEPRPAPVAAESRFGVGLVDITGARVPPAVGTDQMGRDIHKLFPGATLLLGPMATEDAMKAARGPSILHIGTIGVYLSAREAPPAAADPNETLLDKRDAQARRDVDRQVGGLLRSFIALAGFNRRTAGGPDGALTGLEVAGLDLRGTELVTLAACESGLGEASAGEGVYGLRRAFAIAGAETQVITLWEVLPTETREMMVSYYKKLAAGGGRSAAMREVQLEMLASKQPGYAHPSRWASFVVLGDWRPLDNRPNSPVAPAITTVRPSPRGCGCRVGDVDQNDPNAGGAAAIGLLALAVARRRSARRATSYP